MEKLKIAAGLAWRNVWRNKRRTILTLLTILVGSAMIIFQNAWAKGGHDQMIEDAVSTNMGHIQIHEKGYWENRTIDYAIKPDLNLLQTLKKDKRIAGASCRIHADGLLSYKDTTAGAMIQGVDPESEKSVSILHTKLLPGGRYLTPADRKNIVMGETLAKNLGAGVGSVIAMISQGFDGSIAAEKLTIIGLIRSGNPEYDQWLVLMPLAQATETFSMMDFVHSIAIRLKSSAATDHVRDYIKKSIDPKAVEVLGWEELIPELVQFIVMDNIGAYIFDFILFMVVAFGVLNTIQMSVFERTRELGVMLSIGTTPGQVVSMVMIESLIIAIIGIAGGLLLGYLLSYYFYLNPLDYSDYSKELAEFGMSTILFPADATVLNGAVTAVITLILAMIFSIFPARKAANLKPIDAIRHL